MWDNRGENKLTLMKMQLVEKNADSKGFFIKHIRSVVIQTVNIVNFMTIYIINLLFCTSNCTRGKHEHFDTILSKFNENFAT